MKLGSFYVPDITISQVIQIVKIIYDEEIGSDEALAMKLGHKTTNSGGFIMKLVTLRQLQLIQTGVKGIDLTNLGQKIARPSGDEERKIYKQLLSHIPLFLILRKKFRGKTPDKDGMLIALGDITGLDRSKLDKEVLKIQKLYNDAQKYISSTEEDLSSDVGGMDMEGPMGDIGSQPLEIKRGSLYMRLPMNLEAIEQAEIILSAQKQALIKRKKIEK